MSLDLYERETADKMLRLTPINAPDVGMFDGFVRGTAMATMKGFAKTARAVDMVGAVGPIVQDKFTGGTVAQDRYFREHDDVFGSAVDHWTAKPGEVGTAAEVVGTLISTIPQVIMSPSLTVAATQLATAEDLTEKGVSPGKAQAVGAAQAAGLGLGIWMPILGQNLWQRVVVGGAGFNVVQGAATRGVSGLILEGTPAAEEFKAFDGMSMTLDVLLGAAFGSLAHLSPAQRAQGKAAWDRIQNWAGELKPSDVDAIAALRQAQHLNVDSAPGKPMAPADVEAHVNRVRTAVEQLARGEEVSVIDMPAPRVEADGRFVDADHRAKQIKKESEELAKAYDIVFAEPRGPVNDPQVALEIGDEIGQIIVQRGPAKVTEKDGELVVKDGGLGIVKFIWKHGEKSNVNPDARITRDDFTRAPEVFREFLPIVDTVDDQGRRLLEWQVERADGKRVVYAVRRFMEGERQQQWVTLFVNDRKEPRLLNKPMSEKANRQPESPGVAFKASPRDTGPETSSSSQGGQESGSTKSITEPDGSSANQAAGTPPSEPGEPARPAATEGAGTPDPIAVEAQRFAAENPDVELTIGQDADGNPIRKTAKQFLEDARTETAKSAEDVKLFEVAAACLMGVV